MVRNANSVDSIENTIRLEVAYFRPRHFVLIDEDTNIQMTDDSLKRRITIAKEGVYLKLVLPETTYKSNPVLRHLL